MSETPKTENDSAQPTPQPKKPWHAPTLEETSYTETEVVGGPGPFYDGIGNYSLP